MCRLFTFALIPDPHKFEDIFATENVVLVKELQLGYG